MEETHRCRIGVVDDSTGELIGYKADSLWTLDTRVFKKHEEDNIGLNSVLVRNLLNLLNRKDSRMPSRLRLVVERVSGGDKYGTSIEESQSGGVVAQYLVAKEEGKYVASTL